jgi:large subunit ribosomal protein L4
LEQAKTKALVAKLDELGLKESLIVDVEISEALYLSARNLPRVAVAESATVDPVSLLSYPKVVITVEALKQLEEALSNG